ncbi:MAG: ABC transporter ATP-binding protein [Bacillota bacterium]
MAIDASGADCPNLQAAVSIRALVKEFRVRHGVPQSAVLGPGHWVTSLAMRAGSKEKRFRSLDGVSFDIARGEFFGLLGPNGAGKTTLMKCLATLLTPDSGTVILNGYDVRSSPNMVKLSTTMIGSGQWVAFDWGLTIRENLLFFADLYGLPRRLGRERMEGALEVVGLTAKANRTPDTLSAGERQRMVLAKGFLLRTPVFLMDEPTANLDPIGMQDILQYIRDKLRGLQETTILFTTHRMEEAEELCDRVAILDRGRLVALDDPARLTLLAAGYGHLEIDLSGPTVGLLERLSSLDSIRGLDLSLVPARRVGAVLRVQCMDVEIASRDVARTCSELGVTIESIRHVTPRLGDAFLALTGKGLSASAIRAETF